MVDLENGKRRSTQFSAVVALEDYIEECTVMLKRAAQLRAARSQNSNPIQNCPMCSGDDPDPCLQAGRLQQRV